MYFGSLLVYFLSCVFWGGGGMKGAGKSVFAEYLDVSVESEVYSCGLQGSYLYGKSPTNSGPLAV